MLHEMRAGTKAGDNGAYLARRNCNGKYTAYPRQSASPWYDRKVSVVDHRCGGCLRCKMAAKAEARKKDAAPEA
jgi:hypothetical protein